MVGALLQELPLGIEYLQLPSHFLGYHYLNNSSFPEGIGLILP
jgi:alpha-D-ribose 1-methylphosphonate 5-triphosphate synthase subunit PhnH